MEYVHTYATIHGQYRVELAASKKHMGLCMYVDM